MSIQWRKCASQIKHVIQTISKHYQMANVSDSAVVLAYYTLLSLFPALLVIASLLPYLNIRTETVLESIEPMVPESIFSMLKPSIHSFLNTRSGGVLSIGVIVALWSSSRAVAAFQRTVNGTYGVAKNQNALVNRIVAFFWTVALIAFLFVLMLFLSFGQIILEQLAPYQHVPHEIIGYINAAKWPVTFLVVLLVLMILLLVLMILLYFVPSAKLKWRFVWPGALTATVGWLLLSQAFSLYVKYFVHNMDSYRTIGTFIVLMFWLDFTGLILMFGAVLNAAIQDMILGRIEEQEAMGIPKLLK
ncbi:UNVERIFIED_CONTAM: YihY/virulence factor BrkB family protein [Limosilactobacillus fermentum]|uniref:YihY/virulence factor BrkB family protein n=1 Tax=Limosilactobacillus fermentum TaxID=1613 RepID=A0AAJ5ZTS1_LIMFE|nr:YihY/virulence factor BrkB family protein [Limosilactobacillus fermentum]MED7636079.1 YihY/virulence factor BrkB family protein [Limosilactobacillus fermentum]PTV34073.1 YihY/virulence factor BrkB family protein [Limosilactobacillus fermentum]QAR24678.1 YihY/virulence factor BrkB family protein [Limosilactobacillus fermentum]WFR88678.1 YihY/virulence factor BrkB family protein [Limosilactobacillus fermentum]